MKKKVKKEESVKATATGGLPLDPKSLSSTNCTPEPRVHIDKLTVSFPNEDMNKVVEKINELIDKHDSI